MAVLTILLIPVIAVGVGMAYAYKRGAAWKPEYDRIP